MNATPRIADRPSPPACYAIVAFEVRSASSARRWLGFECGFRSALSFLRTCPGDARLVAVAWFVELSLDECPDGRERLVCELGLDGTTWSEWVPEERQPGHWFRPSRDAGQQVGGDAP